MSARPHGGVPARTITLQSDSRLENVELLARAVRGLCAAAGMDGRDCAQVELAVAEAVNTVIRHAYGPRAGHPVEVAFTLDGPSITLEIADEGEPMPGGRSPLLDFDPDDLARLPEGGMGLFLIHSVMDAVEYRSHAGRNLMVLTKRIAA